jgi:DNA (cytosine-5)-methyltransferase 1
MNDLTVIDTFSGIGGFTIASEKFLKGFKTIQFIENNPFCQKVLTKNFPDIPIHDDIRTFKPKPNQSTVIFSGFPCQDLSIAGKKAGIKKGTRSGLFYELLRIIRVVRPRYVVLENVAAILNGELGTVLGELSQAGYAMEWASISASALGGCHVRLRWFGICIRQDIFANTKSIRGDVSKLKSTEEIALQGKARRKSCKNVTDSDSLQRLFLLQQQPEQGKETFKGIGNRNNRWRETQFRLQPDWKKYLSKPTILRGNDGIPGGLDKNRINRLQALGNAVTPQQAAIPLQRILDIEKFLQGS